MDLLAPTQNNKEWFAKNRNIIDVYSNLKKDEGTRYAMKEEEVANHYDQCYEEYDNMMASVCYNDPHELVKQMIALEITKDSKIIDFGCGSGKLGKLMSSAGYYKMDGLDATQSLLSLAEKEYIYGSLDCLFVGKDDNTFPTKFHKAYDVCTCAGCFMAGHFPATALDDMVKSVKKGGLLFFSLRDIYLSEESDSGYLPKLKELEKNGKIELRKRHMFTKNKGSEEVMANGIF
jgi:2-polyprenyl-3-methyl-5-hydroxy-6-metoxy-1,4-benzoquinol methylase